MSFWGKLNLQIFRYTLDGKNFCKIFWRAPRARISTSLRNLAIFWGNRKFALAFHVYLETMCIPQNYFVRFSWYVKRFRFINFWDKNTFSMSKIIYFFSRKSLNYFQNKIYNSLYYLSDLLNLVSRN